MPNHDKSTPIFHHYVPQFILNNFGEKRKKEYYIQMYDKVEGRFFSSNVKRALGENKFNTVKIGKKEFCIEGVTAGIDGLAAPVVEKIVKDKSVHDLATEDRAALITFIALQINRGTAPRMMHDDAILQLRSKIARSVGEENLPDELRWQATSDEAKLFHMHFSVTSISGICDALCRLDLLLFEAPSNENFVIGDGPVAISNTEPSNDVFGNFGLMCKGIEVYLPISPKLTVALFCPTIREKFNETQKDIERTLRKIEAYQLLSNNDLRIRLEVDRNKIQEAHITAKSLYDAVNSRKTVTADSKNVLYNNSLQILHSERYIVGSSKDLTRIADMVSKDARLARGPRMMVR